MSRRILDGVVVSRAGDKTVTVAVTTVRRHAKYDKKITVTTRYLAHDATNAAAVGQRVQIMETRPLSARKRWVVLVKETV